MGEGDREIVAGHRASGLRITAIYGVAAVCAALISALLLYVSYRAVEGYENLQRATERYITCQQDAVQFREGSDCLTSEARYFITTGDVAHAGHFMEEVETTRRRDKAVDDIEEFLQEETSYGYLSEAMAGSNMLAEVEYYAMRLAAQGYGIDPAALPARIAEVALKPEDAALTAEAQLQRASEMVFGDDYAESKGHILDNVEKSIDALIEDTRSQQVLSSSALQGTIRHQLAMVALLLVLLLATVSVTYLLVIRPLARSVGHIRGKRPIPVTGAYELQFLAHTYNEMLEQQTRSTEKLTYSATHDALTGVYNRAAFDTLYAGLDQSDVGLLIVDVDKFKNFNDTYGHDMGDRVLQRVAQVLQESFRSEDFVARIGGDEFCVIMMHASSRLRGLVEGKIARANHCLQHPEDGLPRVSLSVGVAFGDRENPASDLFKDADTALYRVKRGTRAGCAFY